MTEPRGDGLLGITTVKLLTTLLLVLALAGSLAVTANADQAMQSPRAAKEIVLGLIDATGPLAAQCGMGEIGKRIRAGNVATVAVKQSLALSGAKKSCSGVKNMIAGIGSYGSPKWRASRSTSL